MTREQHSRLFDLAPYLPDHPSNGDQPAIEHVPGTKRSRTNCQRCGARFEYYETQMVQHRYQDLARSLCAQCRNVLRHQMTKHHLTEAQTLALARAGAVCQLCGVKRRGAQLVVDHDHVCCKGTASCGECVRGFVCDPCNRALAGLEYVLATVGLDTALQYLRAPRDW